MRSEQGLSLVEATIILAVASVLSAVLAPSVRSYVQTAQQAAAKKDVETIGTALSRMLTDVGETFVVRNATPMSTNQALAHGTPSHDSVTVNNRVDLLVSDGKVPAKSVTRGSGAEWDSAVNDTNIQKLEYFLILNNPSAGATTDAYRTGATMNGTLGFDGPGDSGSQYNSEHAWRGPYLSGPIGPDPWGYRYAVNVEFLERPWGAGPSGTVNDVVVISSGNNGIIEQAINTDGFTSGNDVFYLISGGTR
jgi:type II secretory pathway pseudopilin PulG